MCLEHCLQRLPAGRTKNNSTPEREGESIFPGADICTAHVDTFPSPSTDTDYYWYCFCPHHLHCLFLSVILQWVTCSPGSKLFFQADKWIKASSSQRNFFFFFWPKCIPLCYGGKLCDMIKPNCFTGKWGRVTNVASSFSLLHWQSSTMWRKPLR